MMYGSTSTKERKISIDSDVHLVNMDKNGGQGEGRTGFFQFEDPFDQEFWEKVHGKYDDGKAKLSWSKCLDSVRAQRIKDKYEALGKDPVVVMMTEWYTTFKNTNDGELLPSFVRQISRIAEILINVEYDRAEEEEDDPTYGSHILTEDDETQKSILHIAAEQNLSAIVEIILDKEPDLMYLTTRDSKSDLDRMPIELALLKHHDESASILIKAMLNERVRMLFEFDKTEGRTRFKFKDFVQNKDMKKTVIAVLDSLINPDWPYIPVEDENEMESEWRKVPDIPVRYHFFYRILDGDDEGRPPKIYDEDLKKEVENEKFNHRSTSCLQALCESGHSEMIIRHPVVRLLSRRKWGEYGCIRIRLFATCYLLFLIFLSIALLGAVRSQDPTKYRTRFDYFRGFCEVCTLVMVICYTVSEIDQMEKQGNRYWSPTEEPYNYFDLLGLLAIFLLIPMRFLHWKGQWHVAAFAYIVNFLRIFKYFPAWQKVGTYCKTIAKIIKNDIIIFAVVYIVIFFAFSGGTYLSFRATTSYNATTGFHSVKVTGFGDILFRGVRAVAEAQTFNDSYDGYNAAVVLLIILHMGCVMVILLNILIAQLSNTYTSAEENAMLQYDIDKTIFLAKLENSRFRKWNLRIKYYQDGDYVNETSLVKELLSDWDAIHSEQYGTEDKLKEFRQIVRDVSKKTKED